MSETRITLTNAFHRTRVSLIAKDGRLSAGQVRRARKELCGIPGCYCGDSLGRRGTQPTGSPGYADVEYSLRTGELLGATFPELR